MKKVLFGLFFLLSASSAFGQIQETRSMAEALASAQPGDLVALDIDNTLLEPVQTLGTDQWYDHQRTAYINKGLPEDRATLLAVQDFGKVAEKTVVRSVESVTPGLVRGLQERGIAVIALTARPDFIKAITLHQLASAGIHFRLDAHPTFVESDVEWTGGVLLVGPRNNKGKILRQFTETSGLRPAKVIFVDDKVKHVNNTDAAFRNSSTPLFAYRYGAADERVRSFNAVLADRQWDYFQKNGVILSDEEAAKLP